MEARENEGLEEKQDCKVLLGYLVNVESEGLLG